MAHYLGGGARRVQWKVFLYTCLDTGGWDKGKENKYIIHSHALMTKSVLVGPWDSL